MDHVLPFPEKQIEVSVEKLIDGEWVATKEGSKRGDVWRHTNHPKAVWFGIKTFKAKAGSPEDELPAIRCELLKDLGKFLVNE